ncbi:hypothetical protein PR048_030590 [Dryococelus australis]|uniref:Uncharacterized protein n=1 Tax=Dryococelus australis TaxID=614101 RepID=A0ABQ9GD90_9NEOP|nr:hypothetical protein PR048_030590 [Dryococelus australis]
MTYLGNNQIYNVGVICTAINNSIAQGPRWMSVGIVPDDAAGRRAFSGISRFPRPCIPPQLRSHLVSTSSALKTSSSESFNSAAHIATTHLRPHMSTVKYDTRKLPEGRWPHFHKGAIPLVSKRGNEPQAPRSRRELSARKLRGSRSSEGNGWRAWKLLGRLHLLVAERLDSSPFHKGEPSSVPGRVAHGIFASGNNAGRCRWSAGFIRGSSVSLPSFHYGAAPYAPQSPPPPPIGSQDLVVKSRPNISTQQQRRSVTQSRAVQSERAWLHIYAAANGETTPAPVDIWSSAGIKGWSGGGGDPRENPPTNGIVRHDSHMRKSGVTRPGIEPGSPWWETTRPFSSATVPPPPTEIITQISATPVADNQPMMDVLEHSNARPVWCGPIEERCLPANHRHSVSELPNSDWPSQPPIDITAVKKLRRYFSALVAAAVAQRSKDSPLIKVNRDRYTTRVAAIFSHLRFVLDDAADRRVFSGISPFLFPLHSGADPFSPRLTFIGSQYRVVNCHPNLLTHHTEIMVSAWKVEFVIHW